MRRSRVLIALGMGLACALGLTTPADAANGPWRQVSAGRLTTCAINTGNSLYCWGNNEKGQVGDGTPENAHPTPSRVGAAGVWSSVSVGSSHTCGITTAKNLYCWGANSYGQTGDGTTTDPRLTLNRVAAAGVWASVSAGGSHTCGITTAKNLYCWGRDDQGEIGDGMTVSPHLALFRVGGTGVWAKISAGEVFTCGLTTAQNLYCWGDNGLGQMGNGSNSTPQLALTRVGAAGVWTRFSARASTVCGITKAKNLYCWGYNEFGQVGNGESGMFLKQTTPDRVGGAGVWTGASVGGYHSCGITEAKNLYCWGSNGAGQVGNGITEPTPHLAMSRVGGAGVWANSSAGGSHTCGITSAGNLYCWGDNSFGQIGNGASGTNQLPLFRIQ